jgi:enoyl-[acyl-carrier-protein] reductase (NADH)
MIWLILANSLLVGAWRRRIGHHSNCTLYDTRTLETLEHMFLTCSWVTDAWQKFNTMWCAIGFAPYPSYGNKLLGIIWNVQNFSKIIAITLFSILRLLWNCLQLKFYGILGVNVVSMTLGKSNFILGKSSLEDGK